MLPYVEHPTLEIGSYTLGAFGVLVIAAVVVEFQIVVRRAPKHGIDLATAGSLAAWAIGLGLVSAHVFDVLLYFPEKLRDDPVELLRVWSGFSSTGGMLGGIAGLAIVARRRGLPAETLARFLDCTMFALPFTLAVGRLGCALQHDHLGRASAHWLAVAFPDGPRFDLGLLEFLWTAAMAAGFLALDRRPRPTGFWVGLFFALYGPARFAMDALRTGDARYLGWTPAQYLMLGATLAGCAVLWAVLRRGARPDAT